MKKIFFIAIVQLTLVPCIFLHVSAQQKTPVGLEEAKKAIEASNEIYFLAFVKGDSSLFINRYTKDCWIMAPNAPPLCGIEAPLEFFKTAYTRYGMRNGQLTTIDVFGDGVEFVTEEGFWKTFDANNRLLDTGKFLVLWKKTPEGWKMFRDFFNSDGNSQHSIVISY
jgi:ketosteroid isomerase-like protein